MAEAAESLAELALAAGDATLSRWAARQGLLAIPSREDLYQAWMRAAALAEHWDDLDQAWRGVWRAVRAIDPLERPRPDTLSIYDELRFASSSAVVNSRVASPTPESRGTLSVRPT